MIFIDQIIKRVSDKYPKLEPIIDDWGDSRTICVIWKLEQHFSLVIVFDIKLGNNWEYVADDEQVLGRGDISSVDDVLYQFDIHLPR